MMRMDNMSQKTTYQIYTFGQPQIEGMLANDCLKWDLHAESDHKEASLLHAKMLILDPEFKKVQIEKIFFCEKTGQKQAQTVKVLKKMERYSMKEWFIAQFKRLASFL